MKTMLMIITCSLLLGCIGRPVVTKTDDDNFLKQNKLIENKVIECAGTGDWLVVRGFHATDDLVANATGIPISHAGVYDSESRQVVEAEGQGVHLTALNAFVAKSYRLIVIRPRWRTEENAGPAWNNAKKLVGNDYDFLGTIGFNFPRKYYCSELAISVYKPWYSGREKFPKVIKPGELYLYGTIIYDSLPRDEIL